MRNFKFIDYHMTRLVTAMSLTFILTTSFIGGKKKTAEHVDAVLASVADSCFLKITNHTGRGIYLLPDEDFNLTMLGHKTIFAPFYTEPGVEWLPYAFTPPEMILLGDHLSRCVRTKEKLFKTDTQCYIRVYDCSYTQFYPNPDMGYVGTFVKYQKRHSILVRCKIVDSSEACR